jgi:plasmid stabilization system protein ParE
LDVAEAHSWYEQRAEGLGAEFVRAYDVALAGIERFPEAYPVIQRGVRRALLRKFPYGVFYVVEDQAIVVLACIHTARDPAWWKRLM